jgi:hypothetical protein
MTGHRNEFGPLTLGGLADLFDRRAVGNAHLAGDIFMLQFTLLASQVSYCLLGSLLKGVLIKEGIDMVRPDNVALGLNHLQENHPGSITLGQAFHVRHNRFRSLRSI